MNTEFHTRFEWFLQMYNILVYKTWMEGTCDMYLTNIHISLWLLNQIGRFFFAEMQIISYIFLILKHIQVSS